MFSVSSGYMPVTKTANDIDQITGSTSVEQDGILPIITAALQTIDNNTLYTTKAFENGTDARNILEYSMSDKAAADRKTVVQKMAAGASLEEAAAAFVSDESFEAWYGEMRTDLEALMK